MMTLSSNSDINPTKPGFADNPLSGLWLGFKLLAIPMLITGVIAAAVFGADRLSAQDNVVSLTVAYGDILLVIALMRRYLKDYGDSYLETLKINFGRVNLKGIKQLAKAFASYLLATAFIFTLMSLVITEQQLNQPQDLGFNRSDNPVFLANLFVVLVVLTPVVEEIIFRGILFRSFLSYGFLVAALVSSLLFGLVHLQLNVVIDTALMAFASAWVFYKTDNLAYSIMLHAAKNLIAFVLIFITGSG